MSREATALIAAIHSDDSDTVRDAERVIEFLVQLLHNPAVDDFYSVSTYRLEARLVAMRVEREERVRNGGEAFP